MIRGRETREKAVLARVRIKTEKATLYEVVAGGTIARGRKTRKRCWRVALFGEGREDRAGSQSYEQYGQGEIGAGGERGKSRSGAPQCRGARSQSHGRCGVSVSGRRKREVSHGRSGAADKERD